MPTITLSYDINNGDTLDADKVMQDLNDIVSEYNASIGGLSGDLITTTNTKTMTNKTLTAPTINGGTQNAPTLVKPVVSGSTQTITADVDGATITFDLAASNVHAVTLGGNRTLALSNAAVGQYFAIELTQDATGSRTVTWFGTIRWVGGTVPTLTTTANKRDTFMFRCTGSGTYDGYIVGQNI